MFSMHSEPTARDPMALPDFQGQRVLVVDDSRAIRLFMSDLLAQQGAEVVEVGSGEEALARWVADGPFELLLLDLNLPVLDGIAVLERIRVQDQACTIVMITGAGGLLSATRALACGADGYIEKQHLSSDDPLPLLQALRQAMEYRAGRVAQRQLEQLKVDFYSMVTHDLRNPAGNVLAIVKLLLSTKPGPLTSRQEQLLGAAQRSADKLVGLINDYLDFAKIDAGYLQVEVREVDLRELVQRALRLVEPSTGVKRQTVVLQLPAEPVRAMVDPERLEQVLENLLSNAAKYTPDEGRVTVSLEVEGETAVIRVSDTGVGIAPEQVARLFSPFHRVPGETARQIRGTGLGLVIVKEIVEAHQGQVLVESDGVPGRGSTFVVRLPLRAGGGS